MKIYFLNLPSIIFEEAMEIRRRHRTLIVNALNLDLLKLVRNHHLTTLKVHEDMSFADPSEIYLTELIEILNCLPSLETLSIIHYGIVNDVQNENEVKKVCVNIKNLVCPYQIIHIFDCESIQDLTVENNVLPHVKLTRQAEFINFLNRQNGLESLKIGAKMFEILHGVVCDFHLKKFDFWLNMPYFMDWENLINFLNFHKSTLTSLHVSFITNDIIQLERLKCLVYRSLLNLKVLDLNITVYDINENHIEEQISSDEPSNATHVTENIETFYFHTLKRSLDENMQFISMFPNIKHLEMFEANNYNNPLMNFVSITIQNLESFNFSFRVYFDNNNVPFFPNLKEFTVQEYINLDLFVTRHANTLETINFNSLMHFFFTPLLAEEIFKCTNLKCITFNIGNEEDFTKVVSILHEKWPRTKTLAIVFRGLDRSTTFKLPEDSLFWFNFNPRDHNLIF